MALVGAHGGQRDPEEGGSVLGSDPAQTTQHHDVELVVGQLGFIALNSWRLSAI